MSWRVQYAWKRRKPIIQTALDDLESFFWVLIWCIAHITKDINGETRVNKGIEYILEVWSRDLLSKFTVVDFDWTDAVFGDLVRDWLETFRKAANKNAQFTKRMSTIRWGSQEWDYICNELESYCSGIYEEVLESGFRNLEKVTDYSDWDNVVTANLRSKFGTIWRQ